MSIYARAILLIGTCLAVITAIINYLTFEHDRAERFHDLHARLLRLAHQQAVSVSGPLWNLNKESARLVLQGVTLEPDFMFAAVLGEKGRDFVQIGIRGTGAMRAGAQINVPIVLSTESTSKMIGTLSLEFSLDRLRHAQREAAWKTLALALIQLVAVFAGTALALRAVTKPLGAITRRMVNIAHGQVGNGVPHTGRDDEIGDMARAVEVFRSETLKRKAAEQELRRSHDELEARVAERTRALSESEGRYRAVSELTSGVFYAYRLGPDDEFTMEWCAGKDERLRAILPETASSEGCWLDRVCQEDAAIIAERLERLRAGESSEDEFRVHDAAGNVLWVRAFGRPERHPDSGRIVGFIGAVCDITARKEAEHKLHQVQKLETVGELTGGIAHDFNNLLTVVLGNLDLLKERVDSDSLLRPFIDRAGIAAGQGAELTKRLLAFARRQPLHAEVVSLNETIVAMDDLLHQALGEHIERNIVLAPGLWHVKIDVHQFENMLLNLVVNARHALPQGGTVTIETANVYLDDEDASHHASIAAGDYVMLTVRDTGVGMPPDVLHRAFEPFFTTREADQGTGLGLSMIYGFVQQSKGHVELASDVGHGTTVTAYFPRTRATRTRKSRKAAASTGGLPKGTETILVVEDDTRVRMIAATLLESMGYRVIQAGSGPDAMAILGASPEVKLLFTDIVMPGGMNGFELGNAARKQKPDLKVLYTSGYPTKIIDRYGPVDEDHELMSKPYERTALAQGVRNVLDA